MRSGPAVLLVCVALLAGGCRDTADSSTAPKIVALADCDEPRLSDDGFLEIRGQAPDGVTLWGLLFLTASDLRQGQEIKIVWSMTGEGPVTMSATGPDLQEIEPTWGPEDHGTGSNWPRPGEEWGSGWVFPSAGCWTVRVRQGSTVGLAGVLVHS